jgi:nucleoid-associated protein YgaU
MSTSTATRARRLTQPTATPQAPQAPQARATERRTLTGPGCSVGGATERPVLRIVADDESAPVFTRVLPPDVSPAPVSARRVRLDDFFAPEYDGDDQRVEIPGPCGTAVRLTRRGRVAVLVASVVGVVGLGLAAASASTASDHAEQTRVVTVVPGQTLWDISARAAGGGDVRSMMTHIEAINHLDSASLRPGQHLRIPR